ncbi:hypothetical protein [Pendulispora albinea]|uniref:WD40 repeat domain-containing protein n=1 Tax=Pendulispora albinea TaxID=2741071 RepID=A0ABZ2MA04_9BACT
MESVQDERPARRIRLMTDDVGRWALSDDGHFLAYATMSTLQIASVENGAIVFQAPIRGARAFAVSNRYVAVSDDGVLRVWTLLGKEMGSVSLAALHDAVTAVAIRPDESGVVVGTARGRVWELAIGDGIARAR